MPHLLKIQLLTILLLSPYFPKAQVGITAVPFLEINTDAASNGLAGADVAKKGGNGWHLNPAIIRSDSSISISGPFGFNSGQPFFSTNWLPSFSGSDLYLQSPRLLLGYDRFSLAFHYTYLNLGDQQITTETSPEVIGSFNAYEFTYGIASSYAISKSLSIGAGLNFFKSNLSSNASIEGDEIRSPTGITFDLGVYYEQSYSLDDLKLTPSLGWSLTDIGQPISYAPGLAEDPLPIIMRGGFGIELELQQKVSGLTPFKAGFYGSLSKLMARKKEVVTNVNGVNVTTFEAVGPVEAIFQSWGTYTRFDGLENIELSVWEQFRRHTGVEVNFMEILSLRLGNFYEDKNNGARQYQTLGIGLRYKYVGVDYTEISNSTLRGSKFLQAFVKIPLDIIGLE